MKTLISRTLVLTGLCLALFSYKPGGEGYEIYIGKNLWMQHFGSGGEIKALQWTPSIAQEELIIKYYHCGKAGKARVITLKDMKENTLKQFRYPDASTPAMSLQMKAITDLTTAKKAQRLKLYYSSTELPAGRMLAEIDL